MELRIESLSKTYPNGVRAVQDVNLCIPPGMFGLLGPNGAGKSTLMRIVAALQQPDAGSVRFGDIDVASQPRELRKALGYLPQEFGLYPKVAADDLLDHFAVLKGVTQRKQRKALVEAVLRQTNLWDVRRKKVGGYSGGMRQRFGIAVALLGSPQLIIVDEPTAGLDPEERVRFLNLLAELSETSVVILSTHIVDDVEELCSRMAVIERGQILMEASPLEAVEALRGQIWRRLIDRAQLAELERDQDVISTRLVAGRTAARVRAPERPGEEFSEVEPGLEDVYFIALRGHGEPDTEPEALTA